MKGVGLPIPLKNIEQLLFLGRRLDFQSTADQTLIKQFAGTNYMVTKVIATNKTGGTSVACTGGVYSQPAKAGSAVVSAAQSWLGLTVGLLVDATVAAITAQLSNTSMYLSLTTGSTAACTADVYVFGVVLD